MTRATLLGAAAGLCLAAGLADATALIQVTTIGWSSKPGVCLRGVPNQTYTLRWTRAGVTTGTAVVTPPSMLPIYVVAPSGTRAGDRVRVVGKSAATDRYVSLFDPPDNIATTTHEILAGSAGALGLTFDLSGGFEVIAIDLDRDAALPTYGDLTGVLPAPAFSVVGTSTTSPDTFELFLDGDVPYLADLASVLDAPSMTGQSIEFSLDISGSVIFGGTLSGAFAGQVLGTASYDPSIDGLETYNVSFEILTDLGPIGGTFESSGVTQVVPEPCSEADLALPYDMLDFFDVLEFLMLFDIEDEAADMAEPFGLWDFFDILAFLGLFDAGCP